MQKTYVWQEGEPLSSIYKSRPGDLRVEAKKMIEAGWLVENVMAALELPLEEQIYLEGFNKGISELHQKRPNEYKPI